MYTFGEETTWAIHEEGKELTQYTPMYLRAGVQYKVYSKSEMAHFAV